MSVKIVRGGQQARQGDVLLVEAPRPSRKGNGVRARSGRKVLAYGEVTGHAHALHAQTAVMEIDGAVWVMPEAEALLTHEEHGAITLSPVVVFVVARPVEYDPELERIVRD